MANAAIRSKSGISALFGVVNLLGRRYNLICIDYTCLTMLATDTLSLKQRRFVDAYVLSGNASEAARRAGYSEKTARVIGPENLQKPAVIAALATRQAAYAAELLITKDDVIAGVLAAINMARKQENPAAMIQGCNALAKMLGFLSPEISSAGEGANAETMRGRMAALSDAELMIVAMGESC